MAASSSLASRGAPQPAALASQRPSAGPDADAWYLSAGMDDARVKLSGALLDLLGLEQHTWDAEAFWRFLRDAPQAAQPEAGFWAARRREQAGVAQDLGSALATKEAEVVMRTHLLYKTADALTVALPSGPEVASEASHSPANLA